MIVLENTQKLQLLFFQITVAKITRIKILIIETKYYIT